MPNTEMTLEQAQERIVELTEENTQLKADKDTLSQNNEQLTKDNEDLRTLNQKYFNKLIMQEKAEESQDDEEENEVQSCEDFAKDFKFD